MRILGFECGNLKARKTGLCKFEKISYGRLTSIAAFINTLKLLGDSEVIRKKLNIGRLLTGNKYIAKYKMKQNTYLPSLIKMYCLQLHETIDSSVYRRLLSVCPGIDKNE